MLAPGLGNVAETISEGIAIRGIYLLMDERLDLICGPGTLQRLDNPEVTQKIAQFATDNGWLLTRHQAGFLFWSDDAISGRAKARREPASGPFQREANPNSLAEGQRLDD